MVSEITAIQQAIKIIVKALQEIPRNIVPSDHVGVKCPASEDDLPAVIISVKNIKESGSGIGNFVVVQKEDADRVSEIKGSKLSGVFQVKIWDLSDAKIDEITTAVVEIINTKKIDLENGGFTYLSLNSFGEIYSTKISTDPLREAMVRLIEYQGIFELINRKNFGPEGVIKEVHVHIDDIFDENVTIK